MGFTVLGSGIYLFGGGPFDTSGRRASSHVCAARFVSCFISPRFHAAQIFAA
jgi:hypothetical protein